jgi:hypothetical protein
MNFGGWTNFHISRDNICAIETQVHTVPDNDYRIHELDTDCWCHPEEIEAGRYAHNALDRREEYEEGRKLQ